MAWTNYFAGRHAVITGGSSGIGYAIAESLLDVASELTLVARRASVLEEAAERLKAKRPQAQVHVLSLDISDAEAVERTMAEHDAHHPTDILINNAGIAMPGRFLETDAHHFEDQMRINYFGAVHMCRSVLPKMIRRGHGHVANVGSILSVMGVYGYSAYAATKFALYGFSECLRAEMKPHGIGVTVLLPPDTDTPQHAQEMAHLPEETKAIAGSVKMLTPEAVAEALLKGMAAGRFEVVPGFDGRMSVAANRLAPGLVRWFCDRMQKKAGRPSRDSVAQPS